MTAPRRDQSERSGAGPSDAAALSARVIAAEADLHAVAMRWLDPMPMPAELTLRQVQVLSLVRATPDITGAHLAGILNVSTPTASGIIDRIASKGWLKRTADPLDRRRVLLRITEAGGQVLAGLEGPAVEARGKVMARLGEDDLADLARVLERMRDVALEIEGERTERCRTQPD